MNPKVKLAINIVLSVVTGGVWVPFWLGWVGYQAWRQSEVSKYQLSKSIKEAKFEISQLEESLAHHSDFEKSLSKFDVNLPDNGPVVRITNVRLYESRVGASITSTSGTLQAQTKTGTVGIGTKLGPVGIGLAASKGETRGTINSSSVTQAGKDEMTQIDQGELIVSVDSISFSGEQFSRSVNFESLLAWQISQNEMLISSKSSEKNWLVAINSDSVATYVGQILEYLVSSSNSQRSSSTENSLLKTLKSLNMQDTRAFQDELARMVNILKELESPSQ